MSEICCKMTYQDYAKKWDSKIEMNSCESNPESTDQDRLRLHRPRAASLDRDDSTSVFHPDMFENAVVIDSTTRLGKCPQTGDWRFFQVDQNYDEKNSSSSGVKDQFSVQKPRVRSAEANTKVSRRRRYFSLKPEDMGVKLQDGCLSDNDDNLHLSSRRAKCMPSSKSCGNFESSENKTHKYEQNECERYKHHQKIYSDMGKLKLEGELEKHADKIRRVRRKKSEDGSSLYEGSKTLSPKSKIKEFPDLVQTNCADHNSGSNYTHQEILSSGPAEELRKGSNSSHMLNQKSQKHISSIEDRKLKADICQEPMGIFDSLASQQNKCTSSVVSNKRETTADGLEYLDLKTHSQNIESNYKEIRTKPDDCSVVENEDSSSGLRKSTYMDIQTKQINFTSEKKDFRADTQNVACSGDKRLVVDMTEVKINFLTVQEQHSCSHSDSEIGDYSFNSAESRRVDDIKRCDNNKLSNCEIFVEDCPQSPEATHSNEKLFITDDLSDNAVLYRSFPCQNIALMTEENWNYKREVPDAHQTNNSQDNEENGVTAAGLKQRLAQIYGAEYKRNKLIIEKQRQVNTSNISLPGTSPTSPDGNKNGRNVSLLSWLKQSRSGNVLSVNKKPCDALLRNACKHRCSLPDNRHLLGTEVKQRNEDKLAVSHLELRLNQASTGKGEDESDGASCYGSSSVNSKKSNLPNLSSTGAKSTKQMNTSSSAVSSPLGVDEDIFTKQFNQVPKINIFSSKEFNDRITKLRENLSDPNLDWSKRVDALKEIRACFYAGIQNNPDFSQLLVTLEPCVQFSVRDLRSQVVREACITIAFMAQELGKEFGHFAESILQSLINLVPNSAKIMATSSTVCIRFILQFSHVPKLIPIITSNLTSKSSVIRKQCCEFLYQILSTWPTHTLERHIAVLQEAIKKGIGDADADARVQARKAFWSFADHFKGQADSLMHSLDAAKQKQLLGEHSGNSASNTSLNNVGRSSTNGNRPGASTRSSSIERTSSGYGRQASGGRRATIDNHDGVSVKPNQSSSAVDLMSLSDNTPGHSGISRADGTRSYHNSSGSLPRPRKSSFSGASNYSQHATPSAAERSRSRTRVGVSQSQPSSRSNSPAARFSYITPIQPDVVQSVATNRRRSNSGMSKSRESSREGSPNRSYGRERRLSGQSASGGGGSIKHRSRTFGSQRSCPGDDLGSAVSDALHGPKSRGRNENYDSDDAASETSSICSDGSSYWASGRQLTEDMSEIIACMCSGSWSDRRDGLLALTSLLANNKTLSRSELKKVTDIFTRMFHDPHGKVFSVFLDSLVQLVLVHHNDMSDWLYVLLTRLLTKTGADMLGSVHAKVQRALDVVRGSFPTGQQFALLSRFLIDQTQSPNLKVKVSMLSYFHGLIQLMVPTDFINSSDIRLAISRIITWTTEPKSVDVRKAAQAVLLALHNLNTSEFDVMMSVLPKTFQEGAERILQNRLRPSGQASESSSPRNSISPITTCNSSNRAPPLGLYSMKTEPLNSEDIYNSIKRTSDDIHNLVKCEPQVENHRRRSNSGSKSDSPVCAVSLASGRMLPTSLAIESRIPSFLQNLPNSQEFAKSLAGVQRGVRDENLQNRISYNQIKMEKNHIRDDCLFNEDLPTESTSDQLQDILIELSNHNEREEERKSALLNLMKKAREESIAVWDEYFNAVLLMLLETLGDGDGHIRALALRVLAEFLRCQPERFREYVELTIVRSLEAHKDPVKEVTRAAEECISLLARVVAPDRCHVVLRPLIECEDFPVNLAAVKMLTQVIEDVDSETVSIMMPDIVPSLLKGYENYQSSVRKASVVCLVAIYMSVGEEIRPFLQDLHGSKVKLLNVYIKRALEQQGTSSCATSKTSSPTSVIET